MKLESWPITKQEATPNTTQRTTISPHLISHNYFTSVEIG